MLQYKKYAELLYKIIGASMEVHKILNFGLLEAVYAEALNYELSLSGIKCEQEKIVSIFYKNHQLEKSYKLDLLVGDVIVELKSVNKLSSAHRAQLCNYLRLTKKPVGLLINFGEKSLTGERWVYDKKSNQCILVDRDMEPINNLTIKKSQL